MQPTLRAAKNQQPAALKQNRQNLNLQKQPRQQPVAQGVPATKHHDAKNKTIFHYRPARACATGYYCLGVKNLYWRDGPELVVIA